MFIPLYFIIFIKPTKKVDQFVLYYTIISPCVETKSGKQRGIDFYFKTNIKCSKEDKKKIEALDSQRKVRNEGLKKKSIFSTSFFGFKLSYFFK